MMVGREKRVRRVPGRVYARQGKGHGEWENEVKEHKRSLREGETEVPKALARLVPDDVRGVLACMSYTALPRDGNERWALRKGASGENGWGRR
ncbi:hypothetical protein B0H19DRAFT_1180926 [Mycena capillaripes]|nr:hypothetical protein B0H19DRAFT_1180926 [Mycena capillaripes]